MQKTTLVAEKVHGKLVGFDPALILILVQVLATLGKMLMDCNKSPKDALKSFHNPNMIEGRRFKSVLRKHMFESDYDTGDVDDVFAQVKSIRKTFTLEDVEGIYSEVPTGSAPEVAVA